MSNPSWAAFTWTTPLLLLLLLARDGLWQWLAVLLLPGCWRAHHNVACTQAAAACEADLQQQVIQDCLVMCRHAVTCATHCCCPVHIRQPVVQVVVVVVLLLLLVQVGVVVCQSLLFLLRQLLLLLWERQRQVRQCLTAGLLHWLLLLYWL
jgi:hypothetical protein